VGGGGGVKEPAGCGLFLLLVSWVVCARVKILGQGACQHCRLCSFTLAGAVGQRAGSERVRVPADTVGCDGPS
jgi:hypothetical protein